jgi:aminopeptidase N
MNRLVLLPLFLAAASSAAAQPAAIAPGDGFEVERYTVALRPDLATTALSGTETIVVRSTSDRVAQLAFTANALRISGATMNAMPVEVSSTSNAIIFTLPQALRKGRKATLRFRFDGTPARGLTAVAGGIYANYFACDWMVCLQDAPGDKAHLALNLFLPAGVQSVGVGRASQTPASANALVVHRWRSTRPYSPYLYAFAAGPLARHAIATAHATWSISMGQASVPIWPRCSARRPQSWRFSPTKRGCPCPTADMRKC